MHGDALHPALWVCIFGMAFPENPVAILKLHVLKLFLTYILVSSTKSFHFRGAE